MNIEQKLKLSLMHTGKTQTLIAQHLGVSRALVSAKLKRNTFTKEDLEKIAEAIGGKFVCYFEFPDGTRF